MADWSAVLDFAFQQVGQRGGDGGDSGNRKTNVLQNIANQPSALVTTPHRRVVTQRAPVTTATLHLRPGGDIGGSVFRAISPAFEPPVTTATTVTTSDKLIADEALDRLRTMNLPECFGPAVWSQLLLDAEVFFQRWLTRAQSLNWSSADLLGVHPCAPNARYDAMGLLWLIRGGEVMDLQRQHSKIKSPGGSVLTYRKHRCDGTVLPWQLIGTDNRILA